MFKALVSIISLVSTSSISSLQTSPMIFFEGVGPLILKRIIQTLVKEEESVNDAKVKQYNTYTTFLANDLHHPQKTAMGRYGPLVKLTAAECRTLIRLPPLMIGKSHIPEKCREWASCFIFSRNSGVSLCTPISDGGDFLVYP